MGTEPSKVLSNPPDPAAELVKQEILRWFRDLDPGHPAVKLLLGIALERKLTRSVPRAP
jgi:hypothetical protein